MLKFFLLFTSLKVVDAMKISALLLAATSTVGLAHEGHDGFDHEHIGEYGSATVRFNDDKSAFNIVSSHLGFASSFHQNVDASEYEHLLTMTDPWGVEFSTYSQEDIHIAYAYILYALEKM